MRSLLWRRHDAPGHDHVRITPDGDGWRLRGVAVFGGQPGPCRLEYEVRCDTAWVTRGARVSGSVGNASVDLAIAFAGGRWTLGSRAIPGLDGCVDVDLNFTPATNLLPIRRLALPVGGKATVSAAWLRFPTFTLERLEQTYERQEARRYAYTSGGGAFTAELVVDDFGLPVAYGGLWTAEA